MILNHSEPNLTGLTQILAYLDNALVALAPLTVHPSFEVAYNAITTLYEKVRDELPLTYAYGKYLETELDSLIQALYKAQDEHGAILIENAQFAYDYVMAESALCDAWQFCLADAPNGDYHSPRMTDKAVNFVRQFLIKLPSPIGIPTPKVTEHPVSSLPSLQAPVKECPNCGHWMELDSNDFLVCPICEAKRELDNGYGNDDERDPFDEDEDDLFNKWRLKMENEKSPLLNKRVRVSSPYERLDGQEGVVTHFTGTHYVVDVLDKENFQDRILLSPADFEVVTECSDCDIEVKLTEHNCPVNPPQAESIINEMMNGGNE